MHLPMLQAITSVSLVLQSGVVTTESSGVPAGSTVVREEADRVQPGLDAAEERLILVDESDVWPPDVRLVLASLERTPRVRDDRRAIPRIRYRARAGLKLHSAKGGEPPHELYIRDVNHRGLGFVTAHRLATAHGGALHVPTPSGTIRTIGCVVLRCREVAPGWYEAAVSFNREESDFHPAVLLA